MKSVIKVNEEIDQNINQNEYKFDNLQDFRPCDEFAGHKPESNH